jgi:hypothetical protein
MFLDAVLLLFIINCGLLYVNIVDFVALTIQVYSSRTFGWFSVIDFDKKSLKITEIVLSRGHCESC